MCLFSRSLVFGVGILIVHAGEFSASAFATPPVVGREQLDSVVWMQTSVEYAMLCEQAFSLAASRLPSAVRNREVSACLEQTEGFCDLPPAMIMDVDETVLDNGPFQARMVKGGVEYSPQAWATWCEQAKAKPLPGALALIQQARQLGVRPFFVTNRDAALKEATWRNLSRALGDPKLPRSSVLCRGEKADWTSDKSSRRSYVARTHRVVMLFGDDYNDFAYLGLANPSKRKRLADAQRAMWGRHWFLLPNPVYGTWEKAAMNYERMKHDNQIRKKYDLLETGN